MNLRKKQKEQPEKITQAIFVIDESGSMASCRAETISGINEQIQELKKHKDIKTRVTFITFSGTITDRLADQPIDELEEISANDYHPSGSTALYDAVAHAILTEENRKYATPDVTRILIVVTDGDENSSKEYSRYSHGAEKIAEMIKRVQKHGWTISYMGANQDLTRVQKNFGLNASNIACYNSSAKGTKSAFTATRGQLGMYMTKRCSVSANYLQEGDYGLVDKFYNENEEISSITEGDEEES